MATKNISDKELDNRIDDVLVLFSGHIVISDKIFDRTFRDGKITDEERMTYATTVMRKMVDFDLVKEWDAKDQFGAYSNYELTPFGRDVLKYGSWISYRQNKHQKEIDDAELLRKTLKDYWVNRWLSVIAVAISLSAVGVTVEQCNQERQELDRHEVNAQPFDSAQTKEPVSTPIDPQDSLIAD